MAELYYMSLRDIFSDNIAVTSAAIYKLDPVSGTTQWPAVEPKNLVWIPWEDTAHIFRGKSVCFVVHGFNVNVDHAVKGAGPMVQEFENLGVLSGLEITDADIVVGVMWPGDGFIATSWFTGVGNTKPAGKRFAELLVSSAFQAAEVSFVTHSLGARLVLETVTRTVGQRPDFPFQTAIFMAAAIANNALEDKRYAPAIEALKSIVILSSKKDEILRSYFLVGDVVENALWWGYGGNGQALGLFGPKFKPGSAASQKSKWYAIHGDLLHRHGDYMPHGWESAAPDPNGWSEKRRRVARFIEGVFDERAMQPILADWAVDKTGS